MPLRTIQRKMPLRSIYMLFAPVFIIFAVLACAGTSLNGTPEFTCPTAVPETVLSGTATPMPQPTAEPSSSTMFYVGDGVMVDDIQFRLGAVESYPASPEQDGSARSVYSWTLEVSNMGDVGYEIFPAFQMILTEVITPYGEVEGTWASGQAAADEADLTIDNGVYTLPSGETQTFHFAAFALEGEASRFSFALDPTVSSGSSTIDWINQLNPDCPQP